MTFQPSEFSNQLATYSDPLAEETVLVIEKKAETPAWVKTYFATGIIRVPLAWAVSYKRNQSIPWALVHGFISTPYLIYTLALDGKRS